MIVLRHRAHLIRRILRTLGVLALLAGTAPRGLAATTNLLPDGGFEAGQWTLTRWDRGEGRLEFSDDARHGHKAVKLTGLNEDRAKLNLLAYSPPIDIQADREYVLSVWHRSTGSTAPSVSIFTYRQPWSTAQWKTETTAYQTRRLPPSQQWSPWTWRFRAAPGSVQLIVAVRNSELGTVWFDDVALLPANGTRLSVAEPGTLTALPDRRRLKADVAWGDGAGGARLSLRERTTGRPLGSVEISAARPGVELAYGAPEGTPLVLALEDAGSGAVLATEEFTAPPLVEFELLAPRYRNSIYRSLQPKEVRARLRCNAEAALRDGMAWAVQADRQPAGAWQPLAADNDVRWPLALAPEARSLELAVLLKGVPQQEKFVTTLKVVPPAPAGSEVIIGPHRETLVNGQPFFPAGFFGMRTGPTADPIAKAGYTAALTYDTDPQRCKAWLDDCRRLGLLGMVSVPHAFVARFDETKLREAIRVVKQHPALLGYYLYDEPSPTRPHQAPADLKRVYDVVADEDPYHPIGVCICVPQYFGLYEHCYDMVMPDPYPLVKNRRPLTWVAEWMDAASAAVGGRKPVWVVPQAFGWEIIENIPDPESYRTPTPAQARAMTYLALAHGARGVMYYCYHVYTGYDAARKSQGQFPYILGGYLPDRQPVLWSGLEKLGGELRQLGPGLLSPGGEQGSAGSVHWRILPPGGRPSWRLIAVNADETSPATVTAPLRGAPGLKVVFGDGTARVAEEGVVITLPPAGTLAASE